MNSELLKDKFIGCLLGTFVGDALGMPVEGYSFQAIKDRFGILQEMVDARLGVGTYTDDTEMMIGVLESLVECGGFDGEDMAKRFLTNYNPRRGYGGGTRRALHLLELGRKWYEVGEQVFPSGGSFGNGSSMRIAPIGALYYDDISSLRKVAYDSSRITHSHILGKEGAALQAFAIAKAIERDPNEEFNPESFLSDLIEFTIDESFRERLGRIRNLLRKSPDEQEILNNLGNNSTALNSVPTAIYSFLSHPNSFREAIVYAVNLGGDSDTIGAMTGAISGGYHGKRNIPLSWLNRLENIGKGRDYIEELGEKLWLMKTK
jgi:poly(ADP-ribose) glycohydrolase ARH3